jgi:hypothetical protein
VHDDPGEREHRKQHHEIDDQADGAQILRLGGLPRLRHRGDHAEPVDRHGRAHHLVRLQRGRERRAAVADQPPVAREDLGEGAEPAAAIGGERKEQIGRHQRRQAAAVGVEPPHANERGGALAHPDHLDLHIRWSGRALHAHHVAGAERYAEVGAQRVAIGADD